MLTRMVGALAIAAALAACAPVQDFSGDYEAYDRAYRAEHAYIEHAVPRDGHTLHAREYSPSGNTSGAPIVLMHGFPDSVHLYDPVAPLLAAERRVIAFDFLGWGKSDKPSQHEYDFASLRRDLDAVIDHFELNDVVLVVHDSSGPPGIDWALNHPDRTAQLVLLNTIYAASEHAVMPDAIAQYSDSGIVREVLVFGANQSDGQWQSGFMEQVGVFFSDPAAREDYLKVFAHQSLDIRPAFFGLNGVLRAELAARRSRLPELRALEVPVKIVFGADDPFLNADVAREFHEVLPNSELHLVAGAGHYVQLDRPETVAELILRD